MDYTPEEILYLIDLAADLKSKKKQGILHDSLIGKNIALIFEKTSTRTRCSFEVAAHDLGMHVTCLLYTSAMRLFRSRIFMPDICLCLQIRKSRFLLK